MKQTSPCPKCGALIGWWKKHTTTYQQYYDENGEPTHAESVGVDKHNIKKFCFDCDTDITKRVEDEK